MSKNQIDSLRESKEPLLIVGLGNNDLSYAQTYHNVGFLCIDHLLEHHKGAIQKKRIPSHHSFEAWEYTQSFLIKPTTYMNTSGLSIQQALSYFSLSPDRLVVIHDDSDITLGAYKISYGRGGAGHKGVSSIVHSLGSNDFTRIRIGIRPSQEQERKKARDFVLSPIRTSDAPALSSVYTEIDTLIM